jgi:hypothetical protein
VVRKEASEAGKKTLTPAAKFGCAPASVVGKTNRAMRQKIRGPMLCTHNANVDFR